MAKARKRGCIPAQECLAQAMPCCFRCLNARPHTTVISRTRTLFYVYEDDILAQHRYDTAIFGILYQLCLYVRCEFPHKSVYIIYMHEHCLVINAGVRHLKKYRPQETSGAISANRAHALAGHLQSLDCYCNKKGSKSKTDLRQC